MSAWKILIKILKLKLFMTLLSMPNRKSQIILWHIQSQTFQNKFQAASLVFLGYIYTLGNIFFKCEFTPLLDVK